MGHNLDLEGGWHIGYAKRILKQKAFHWRFSPLLLSENVHPTHSLPLEVLVGCFNNNAVALRTIGEEEELQDAGCELQADAYYGQGEVPCLMCLFMTTGPGLPSS